MPSEDGIGEHRDPHLDAAVLAQSAALGRPADQLEKTLTH
jgi:hypothetical protein